MSSRPAAPPTTSPCPRRKPKELIGEVVQANGAAAGGSTNLALSMAAAPLTDSVPLSGGQALGHELDQLLPSRPRTPTAPYLATTSSRADRTIRVSISARSRPAVTVITPSRSGVQAILALGQGLNSVPPLLHQIVLNELDRAPGTRTRAGAAQIPPERPTHSAARSNRQLLSQRPARRRRPPTTRRHG